MGRRVRTGVLGGRIAYTHLSVFLACSISSKTHLHPAMGEKVAVFLSVHPQGAALW